MPRQPQKGASDSEMDSPPTPPTSGSSTTAAAVGGDSDPRKKKHVCPTCNRGFTTSGHLSRHTRVHSGERNHACPFPGCTTRCSRQDNLQQHYRVHLSPRSRNISTSAARQAMAKKQNELSSGIIDTGTSTPPPMPDDSGRASPPAPASLAYRAQQLHQDRNRDTSPPQPIMTSGLPGPGVAGQQYPAYMPRDSGGPSRIAAPWPPGHQQQQYHPGDRSREAYQHSPTSPTSPHAHSPPVQRSMDLARAQQTHTRQYSSSSTGSLGSLRDASGSDVSLPSFMDANGPPPHAPYNSSSNANYAHPSTAQLPHPSARGASPPPILPPIFTNRAPYSQPLPSQAGAHVYHGHHLHGGH